MVEASTDFKLKLQRTVNQMQSLLQLITDCYSFAKFDEDDAQNKIKFQKRSDQFVEPI